MLGGVKLLFLNSNHNDRYGLLTEKDRTPSGDRDRESLFFICSGNDFLFNHVNSIYDFKTRTINLDIFNELSLSSSEKSLLELAFNLYNNYTHPEEEMNTVYELFRSLDEHNFELALSAIQIRFS